MKQLNMKDIAIIDAFPTYNYRKTVLEVGCGDAKLDFYLADMGYRVYATDLPSYNTEKPFTENLTYHLSNIFDLSSFPVKSAPIVICSQVLEHLKGYKLALVHLIALTEVRLIITVPHERSFLSPDHINFWHDFKFESGFNYIHEFVDLCVPYSTAISKIRTKPQDAEANQYAYLIVVDKRQGFNT